MQRVSYASVSVDGKNVGEIDTGIVALVSVEVGDTAKDAVYIAEKIAGARFFNDSEDKMNLSVKDIGGSVLVISQFTLHGDCRRGRRPSFILSARPETAILLYEQVIHLLRDMEHLNVATGVFGARMKVTIINEGPVTLLLDSKKTF